MSGVTLGQKLNISRQAAWQRLDILVDKGVAYKRMGKVYAK
jgi:biotin operon repressor